MWPVIENGARCSRSKRRQLPTVKGLSRYVIGRRYVDGARVAYKTSADVISKTVTLVVTVAAARALPANEFGVLALAMTTGWILGVASDAGLPMYLATRIAQANAVRAPTYQLVRAAMRWRWRFGGAAMIAGVGVGAVLLPSGALPAFTLVVAHQLFGAMLETLAHAYRGLGRTDIESAISIGHRGAIALGALTVLAVHPSLLWLGGALAVPPMVALAISQRMARRLMEGVASASLVDAGSSPSLAGALHGSPEGLSFTSSTFARDVLPLGLGVLLSALYFRCDVYFLDRLHGVETVGIYNAAFRIVDALRLFPAAVLAVAYPALCAATDFRPLRKLSSGLVIASVMVAAAIFVAAHPLLALVYGGAYAAGGDALQMLSLCIPFFYVNYALTHQLLAWDGQRAYVAIAAGALLANLAGNALLIPGGAMVGAATSTLTTEVVVCAGCLAALRKR